MTTRPLVVDNHAATEEGIRNSGLGWTMLRNNLYSHMQLGAIEHAAASGKLFTNFGDGAAAFVTREDCAAVAASALVNTGLHGDALDVTGPAAINAESLARLAEQVGGQKVEVVHVDDETAQNGLRAAGLPEEAANLVTSFGTAIREGYLGNVTDAVERLTGRAPHAFRRRRPTSPPQRQRRTVMNIASSGASSEEDHSPKPPDGTITDIDTMSVRRLGWAGVEVRLAETRLLIDALINVEALEPVLGPPKRPLPAVGLDANTHALISHLHPDHYDRDLLTRVEGTVGCHAKVARTIIEDGIEPVTQELGQPRQIGDLTVTPVHSLDWRGTDSDQVAWVVEGAGKRIIHCGDTMWHGNWWQIARDHGPFDVAFLPVNGVIARFEGYEANVPVTLSPEQAIEAAAALNAAAACAIHYELFNNPPAYIEQDNIRSRFSEAATARGINPILVGDGEAVPLSNGRSE